MIDGVIFDMDGVIVETELFYFERRMSFFKEKGIQPGSDQLMDYLGSTEQGIWKTLVPMDLKLREQLKTEYQRYRIAHPVVYNEAFNKEWLPVFDTLQAKKKKLAIASSSPRKEIEAMLQACRLQHIFDCVMSGEELRESKPHPEIYFHTAQKLGGGNLLAVEDSVVGIQAAKAAGLFTIAFKQDFPVDQSLADTQIVKPKELLEFV